MKTEPQMSIKFAVCQYLTFLLKICAKYLGKKSETAKFVYDKSITEPALEQQNLKGNIWVAKNIGQKLNTEF